MKPIKPYLFIAMAFLCASLYGQGSITIDGMTLSRTRGPMYFDVFLCGRLFTIPGVLDPAAPSGSFGAKNDKPYYRRYIDGNLVWVPLLDSTSLSSVPTRQIFQYSENLDVTQADTVTALVLNNTNPNTENRTITLKAPSEGLTMYIYNYNSGIFANFLSSPIKEYNNSTVSILDNETSYTLIGDGTFWRVVSKAGLNTSGGGGGGSLLIPNIDL